MNCQISSDQILVEEKSFNEATVFADDDSSDASSAPSPSFQLPIYLSSPDRLGNKTFSFGRSSSTSSTSSSSNGSLSISPGKDQEEEDQRLVLMAKHPHADKAQVQRVIERKRRQKEVAEVVARKKGEQFRRLQQQHEWQQRKSIQTSTSSLPYKATASLSGRSLVQASSLEKEEVDEELASAKLPRSPSSFSIGQPTGQDFGETDNLRSTLQRVSFPEQDLKVHVRERQTQLRKIRNGFWLLATNALGKIFPSDAAAVSLPSSGASVQSESLDGRSANTGNKSMISRASLPSYSSEQTRKINNLSPKDVHPRNNMVSIDEEDGGDGRRRLRRLMTTRNGLIILLLCAVLLVAIIVTVVAALKGRDRQAKDNAITGKQEFWGPAPTQTPNEFGLAIPTMSPKETTIEPSDQKIEEVATTPSDEESTTTGPITTMPVPEPTPQSTVASTSSPTGPPSAAPTMSPTLADFADRRWTQKGLTFQGDNSGERFGQSLAISDDGNILAIGAPFSTVDGMNQAGKVQIFQWNENDRRGWLPHGELRGRNAGDQFGSSIAMSADGSVIAVSEPTYRGKSGDRSGNVRVFVHSPFDGYALIGQELEGVDATDHFGIGLSISSDGKRIVVGAPYHANTGRPGINGNGNNRLVSGHARVFEWSGEDSAWNLIGEPMKGDSHLDWFGWSVDLNHDGSIACVGAPRNVKFGGYVRCFEEIDSEWRLLGQTIQNSLTPIRYDDNFGTTIKVSKSPSDNKHLLAIGSPGKNRDAVDAGVVVVFEFSNQIGWLQHGQVVVSPTPAANDRFSSSFDLEGEYLAIGVPGASEAGQAHLYNFDPTSQQWERHPRIFRGKNGSNFGVAVRFTSSGALAVGSSVSGDANGVGVVNIYQPQAYKERNMLQI